MILRAATSLDVEALLDVQQPAAVQGLGHIFPQDVQPFPREAIASRWMKEITGSAVSVYVYTEDGGDIQGFAAMRGNELLHFGTALPSWGTGLASRLHDAVLNATIEMLGESRLTLRVFEENRRARRFYEKHGWRTTGRTSRTNFPPHPVLVEYERHLTQLPR